MGKTLFLVESAGKINKIQNIVGNDYIVKASYGHIWMLPDDDLNVDVDNKFKPTYAINKPKKKGNFKPMNYKNLVNDLKSTMKSCDKVILAADDDREGEFIAYSLQQELKPKNFERVIFREITKKEILKAIENPKDIDMNMVRSQEARRILDRLIGYKISPAIKRYTIHGGKSAGRVQSAALRIIVDKENDINNSSSNSYFKVN